MLGLITASAFIHPALGLLVCLLIIIPACFIAGPAFRLMVFGNVFGLDLLLARKAVPTDVATGVRAFNSTKIGSTPARTYGRLGRNAEGAAVFRYRPWIILPMRETAVAATPQPDGIAQADLPFTDAGRQLRQVKDLICSATPLPRLRQPHHRALRHHQGD
ncbi:hypothetical protein [Verrucomicrobium spinosum]|uniref:hypothetical protein n=1 Tax=Verrucomicrobium spinosum TaxID=2736 RepID=UPI00094668FF|nr:hypothetical protein [Verrucomicrobium spinosum]